MLGIILGIVVIVLVFGTSWLMTCGIVKLITLCFGWTFTWPIATGVWLILLVLSSTLQK